MADRIVKLRRLKQILASFGVEFDSSRGKGSHGLFVRGSDTYPVPNESDVLIPYVRGCRKKFRLTEKDGVSDSAFYNA